MLRYDSLSMALQDEEPAACAAAFKNRLRQGPLNSKLTRKIPRNMAELRARTDEFVREEEDNEAKAIRDAWGP